MGFSIAIDGPAGAGKSTIAKQLAKDLGFIYVDTGAMYRAIGLYFSRLNISADMKEEIISKISDVHVSIDYVNGEQQVILNGENVNGFIRTPEAGNMASACSAIGEVRSHLMDLQRGLAKRNDVIMDGRDIGTVVLPDANLKIYLTAAVEVRAKRRYEEHRFKGENVEFDKIKKDIEERDFRDMNRAVAPLKQAEDAVLVDTSDMTPDEVRECIKKLYLDRKDTVHGN